VLRIAVVVLLLLWVLGLATGHTVGAADDSVRYQSNERFRGSAVFHVIVLESV